MNSARRGCAHVANCGRFDGTMPDTCETVPENDGKRTAESACNTGAAPAKGERMPSYKAKQMIVVRRDLKMRKGKIAAQAGHACVEAVLMALAQQQRLDQVRLVQDDHGTPVFATVAHAPQDESALTRWFDAGVAKVCVYVDSEQALLDLAQAGRERGFVVSLIQDAGFTEFHGQPTYTCLAFEPLAPEQIDPLTGDLPLY